MLGRTLRTLFTSGDRNVSYHRHISSQRPPVKGEMNNFMESPSSPDTIIETKSTSHPLKNTKSSPITLTTEKNGVNEILEYSASKNKQDNSNLQNSIGWIMSPLSTNINSSEEIFPLNGISRGTAETENFENFGDETSASFLHSNVYRTPGNNYSESDKSENSYSTQATYDPSYEPRTTAFDELDEADDDDDPSSRKKRVKCLQVVILLVSAIILTIVVVYFGREPTETLRHVG